MENTLKILETVNQFYIDSFNQLIMITVMILTFVGVLMPILISLYQKRIFKLEQQEIKNSLLEILTSNLKEIEEKIDAKYSEKEKEYEKKISNLEKVMEQQSLKSLAKIYHLQGNSYLGTKHYYTALESFFAAGTNYLITLLQKKKRV